jgi:hypothetical protein
MGVDFQLRQRIRQRHHTLQALQQIRAIPEGPVHPAKAGRYRLQTPALLDQHRIEAFVHHDDLWHWPSIRCRRN